MSLLPTTTTQNPTMEEEKRKSVDELFDLRVSDAIHGLNRCCFYQPLVNRVYTPSFVLQSVLPSDHSGISVWQLLLH